MLPSAQARILRGEVVGNRLKSHKLGPCCPLPKWLEIPDGKIPKLPKLPRLEFPDGASAHNLHISSYIYIHKFLHGVGYVRSYHGMLGFPLLRVI